MIGLMFKMRCLVLLAVLAICASANRVSYEGFKLYRLSPSNQDQLSVLDSLPDNRDYDFWSEGRGIDSYVDLMVSPHAQLKFEKLMVVNGIRFEIVIENVERVVQKERMSQIAHQRVPYGQITFKKYHRYAEIQAFLGRLHSEYPELVTLENAGLSVEGRSLTVVKISTNPQAKKPIIFIDGGIHAREWIAPATVLYIIEQLVENEENRYLLENVDWHILPLVNPDGYEFSHTNERLWRKNRSHHTTSKSIGVDLNRNFGYHWGEEGTSSYPDSEIYKGESAFSEPEAAAVRDYVLSINDNVKLYLTYHNYGLYILHPWGYGEELPEDAEDLKLLGDLAAAAIYSVNKTIYRVGSVTQLLSPGAGGSDDWAKGGADIKYSYTVELPGGGMFGFDLPATKILKAVVESFEGVKAFHDYIVTV